MVLLHADAIAKNSPVGEGARGIDGENADFSALLAPDPNELAGQGALACSRRTGNSDHQRVPGMREEALDKVAPGGHMIFDQGCGASNRAGIATEDGACENNGISGDRCQPNVLSGRATCTAWPTGR